MLRNQNYLAMRFLMHNLLFVTFLLVCTGVIAQESEYGLASYYGDEFHGSETASGERYNKDALTAAHKTLPMGTRVRVTRMDTKKTVDVRINDKGPYLKGRIIDLSGKAADALGMRKDGTTQVKLDVIGRKGVSNKAPAKTKTPPPVPVTKAAKPRTQPRTKVTTPSPPTPVTTPRNQPTTTKAKTKTTTRPEVYTAKGKSNSGSTNSYREKLVPDAGFEMVVPKNFSQYGLYKIELQKPRKEGFGVQVASLSSYENVMKQVANLQGKWFNNILLSIEKGSNGKPLYKVILGPFPDLSSAKNYQKNARKKGVKGFVTSLEGIEY